MVADQDRPSAAFVHSAYPEDPVLPSYQLLVADRCTHKDPVYPSHQLLVADCCAHEADCSQKLLVIDRVSHFTLQPVAHFTLQPAHLELQEPLLFPELRSASRLALQHQIPLQRLLRLQRSCPYSGEHPLQQLLELQVIAKQLLSIRLRFNSLLLCPHVLHSLVLQPA